MNYGYKFYYPNGKEIKTGDIARRLFDHASRKQVIAGHVAGAEGTVTVSPDGARTLTLLNGSVSPFNPDNVMLVRRADKTEDPTRGERLCRAGHALHEALKARNAAREAVKEKCRAYNDAVHVYDEARAAVELASRHLLEVAGAGQLPDSRAEFVADPLPQPRNTPSDK